MKRILPLILTFAMLLSLCACGTGGGNILFDDASPDTSVMSFYFFDGSGGWYDWISDVDTEQAILAELSKVKAKPVDNFTSDKLTFTMYGFTIGSTDSFGIKMLWTNGYLITCRGEVYKFNYDFGKTMDSLDWGNEWTRVPGYDSRHGISHVSGMPNVRYLALENGQWNSRYMQPAERLSPPVNVTMELVEWTPEHVSVTISSSRTDEWTYGRAFGLEVLLDGTWYTVPQTPEENWGFTSEALLLQPGEEKEENYFLGMYGELPAGHYRLVMCGLSVEQDIE